MKRCGLLILSIILVFVFSGCGLIPGINNGNTREDMDIPAGEKAEEKTQHPDTKIDEGETVDAQQDEAGKVEMKLYFANEDNSAVPYETRKVEVKDGAILRAAIEALLEGPADSSLRRAIPQGTRLLGVNRKDNVAIVDFSGEFKKTSGSVAEVVARVSLVNTLTEIEGIEKVKILVEGKDLIGPSGQPFGELSRVSLDSGGYPIPGEIKTITLYFANSNADKVVAEKREAEVNKGEPIEKVVFLELMKGPASKELHPVIPAGTRLLSIKTENGTCTVDLSSEFADKHSGGSAGELMTINSIVNSLTELPGVERVQFLIEGEKREVFLHAIFDEPFSRYEDIIAK